MNHRSAPDYFLMKYYNSKIEFYLSIYEQVLIKAKIQYQKLPKYKKLQKLLLMKIQEILSKSQRKDLPY